MDGGHEHGYWRVLGGTVCGVRLPAGAHPPLLLGVRVSVRLTGLSRHVSERGQGRWADAMEGNSADTGADARPHRLSLKHKHINKMNFKLCFDV